MFTKAIISTALLAALVAPLAANAGEVQNRINNENARLNQGWRSGQLTRGEYHRLDNRLDRIQTERNRDLRRNGGHLTPGEYARLNRQENRVSGAIYREKHDAEVRH
jgi:hypothetical protein